MSRPPETDVTSAAIGAVFREEHGRAVAVLIRALGDIELAEDAVAEAFVVAVERWPVDGLPPSPAGWIITTARRRAIDRLRRESKREQRHTDAAVLLVRDEPATTGEEGPVRDERLRLIFTCCHPALARPAQVALTLRLLGGLTTTEIARAFFVPEATMAQRIVRAKTKIRDTGIPYRVPHDSDLPERLEAVLTVIYLVFTEGHRASSGEQLVRTDLCAEAIRLARVLAELMPDEPEVKGLLALLLLTDSRRSSRTDHDGQLVRLCDQDRARWSRPLIDEGHALVRECLRRNAPGPYQVQAAINAVHADAKSFEQTDWPQVVALYDQLLALAPTDTVRLNRAVAVAEVEGVRAGLALVEALDLPGSAQWQVARADLLRRLGRTAQAVVAYDAAITLTDNTPERAFLLWQREAVARATPAESGGGE